MKKIHKQLTVGTYLVRYESNVMYLKTHIIARITTNISIVGNDQRLLAYTNICRVLEQNLRSLAQRLGEVTTAPTLQLL